MNRVSPQIAKFLFKFSLEKAAAASRIQSSTILSNLFRPLVLPKAVFSSTHLETTTLANVSNVRHDDLFKKVLLEIRGHDNEVIKSYLQFILMTTLELDIDVAEVKSLPKEMHRRTLLKSAHVHKKHRVQYEWRTYRKVIEIRHLTGSTLSTFLEYIERNLPEGIAMQVSKTQILQMPQHLAEKIKSHHDIDEETKKLLCHRSSVKKETFDFPPPKSIEFHHHF